MHVQYIFHSPIKNVEQHTIPRSLCRDGRRIFCGVILVKASIRHNSNAEDKDAKRIPLPPNLESKVKTSYLRKNLDKWLCVCVYCICFSSWMRAQHFLFIKKPYATSRPLWQVAIALITIGKILLPSPTELASCEMNKELAKPNLKKYPVGSPL
jgi:hypothetical protein